MYTFFRLYFLLLAGRFIIDLSSLFCWYCISYASLFLPSLIDSVSNRSSKQTSKHDSSECLLQSTEWPVSSYFVFYLVFLITLIL